MMFKFSFIPVLYYVIGLSSMAFSYAPSAEVVVITEQGARSFSEHVSLSHVLSQSNKLDKVYWPSAGLYQASSELDNLRAELIYTIASLRQDTNNVHLATALPHLKKEVMSWQLAQRAPILVDYDFSRLYPKFNPNLPSGKYLLSLPMRGTQVKIFGAVTKPALLMHQPQVGVSSYLADVILEGYAELDWVYVNNYSSELIKAPIAYWNRKHVEVMPGGELYVPFRQSVFESRYQKINELVSQLSVNKVVFSL